MIDAADMRGAELHRLLLRRLDELLGRLIGARIANHQDLRIVRCAGDADQVLGLHVRALPLQEGEKVRLRYEQDGVTVLRPAVGIGERRRAAPAGLVDDDELGAERCRCLHHHHARGEVGAAADAGMRHHLDGL
jgi:hypothetical protein